VPGGNRALPTVLYRVAGERYGWIPEEIPEELLAAQPWLNEHRKESVTALEILHGVLRNPQMAEHAFFYFRDPGYAAARAGFTEEDPTGGTAAALKDAISKSGFPVAEDFATPRQLGEWVLRDLTAVIENLYPESSIPDALDRSAADHEAYAAAAGGCTSAARSTWSVWTRMPQAPARPWWWWRIRRGQIGAAVQLGPPLARAAPGNAGDRALHRRRAGQCRLDGHGAAVAGGVPTPVRIEIEIPDQPDALRMALANALHMVAARGRAVLVLDALNRSKTAMGPRTWSGCRR